ncbi:FAD-binding oxidoreductase [Microbacterium maritypicum]|uniref:NAD(P)/FAD-dependent oxidoreductase n=1 Tax=Microbacterium maritypicum TaxID=33918 RepID=UPI001B329EFE|nr:FAD-dependent oxidoreductase [Microbacterium liquefaciens]MBP5801309.1 FAD-binding oxidoreductase [Microbacterium liquefaciens]
MNNTADVVVIGAGVIGCSVAYEFARAGRSVIVVDRASGAGQGSTGASSAVVRFNYSTFTGVAAAWESRQAWEAWEEHLGGTDEGSLAKFHRTGGIVLDVEGMDIQGSCRLFDDVGVPYERWTATDIRHRFPSIDPARYFPPKPVDSEEFWDAADGEIGATWTPDAGFIDDASFAAHNLLAAAQRHGADFRFGQTVVAIDTEKGRVTGIRTSKGDSISCDVLINVAGPHSAVINELAGVLDDFRIRTRPLRQEVHELPGDGNEYPLVADLDLGIYFRRTPAGNLLVGGAEPECDPLEWLGDPDDFNPRATRDGYEAQAYRAARRVPELNIPSAVRGIAGVYDVSSDWVPIYDKTNLDGYYVAIGTSGNQFKNAPVVGGFLRSIVEATEAGVDHDQTPAHHLLPRTGITVNLGDYSRLREPSKTAGNVMG